MTLLQLQYALECYRAGSINKASQNCFTTPSNLSRQLKLLEEEMGFPIFVRDVNGTVLTLQGERFIEQAEEILHGCKQIEALKYGIEQNRFSVNLAPLTPLFDAFCRLMTEYEDQTNLDFMAKRDSNPQIISRVAHHKDDLGIVPFTHAYEETYRSVFQQEKLSSLLLLEAPLYVNLRADHPLLDEEEPLELHLEKLNQYPCADYSLRHGLLSLSPSSIRDSDFINNEKLVYVNDREWKTRLLIHTNTFSIGVHTGLSAKVPDVRSVPIEGSSVMFYVIWSKSKGLSPISHRFLELALEELRKTVADMSPEERSGIRLAEHI